MLGPKRSMQETLTRINIMLIPWAIKIRAGETQSMALTCTEITKRKKVHINELHKTTNPENREGCICDPASKSEWNHG
jgi:hypothetical protein